MNKIELQINDIEKPCLMKPSVSAGITESIIDKTAEIIY